MSQSTEKPEAHSAHHSDEPQGLEEKRLVGTTAKLSDPAECVQNQAASTPPEPSPPSKLPTNWERIWQVQETALEQEQELHRE